jgi:DNA repair protein RadD
VRLAEEDEARDGVAYKVCPDCQAELPLGTAVCPFCGHLWQRRFPEKRLLEAFDLTEIDLLNRSPFRWCDLFGDDQALVASGFDAWGGVFFDGQHWHAVGKPRRGRLRHVAVGTRAQVLAAADDYLREIETTAAASKSRRWLEDPASAKQIELLRCAGYPVSAFDFGLSKYAANCHLSFVWNQAAIKAAVFGAELGRAA